MGVCGAQAILTLSREESRSGYRATGESKGQIWTSKSKDGCRGCWKKRKWNPASLEKKGSRKAEVPDGCRAWQNSEAARPNSEA